MKLLEDRLPISAVTVMVQKEAAQRICAEVGSRMSGAVTVSVNYYAKPQMLFGVSAGSFMPAPKVDSAVIRLDILKEPPVQADEGLFFAVVRAAFSQRAVLEAANVPPTARAEKLSLEDFAAIANAIGE